MKTIGLLLSLFFCTTLSAQKIVELPESDRSTLLETHNFWRSEVKSNPLKWNSTLEKESADYALKLAKSGNFAHSGCDEGENLYWTSESVFKAEDAVAAWASEKEFYRPGTKISNSNYKKFGHYTQVIWYSTAEVGCGAATSRHGTFVVCRYNPGGNVIGDKPTR
jgi:uncharacterized protein YkwD